MDKSTNCFSSIESSIQVKLSQFYKSLVGHSCHVHIILNLSVCDPHAGLILTVEGCNLPPDAIVNQQLFNIHHNNLNHCNQFIMESVD